MVSRLLGNLGSHRPAGILRDHELGRYDTGLFEIRHTVHKVFKYRLGLMGERLVGQVLDNLSSDEIRVFHDYLVEAPGKKPWNIDHIVLCGRGVFAIETKSRMKPADAPDSAKVTFDGSQLIFPEPLKTDYSSVNQAAETADSLSNILTRLTAETTPVTPVLVLPGWYVLRKGKGPVTVLNHKELVTFFPRFPFPLHSAQFKRLQRHFEKECRISC